VPEVPVPSLEVAIHIQQNWWRAVSRNGWLNAPGACEEDGCTASEVNLDWEASSWQAVGNRRWL